MCFLTSNFCEHQPLFTYKLTGINQQVHLVQSSYLSNWNQFDTFDLSSVKIPRGASQKPVLGPKPFWGVY